ncbi:MAG TPA: hypothetical protein VED63_06275 [Acidimicrobiales bacterium]|nr:hypothetical protein [Acidimicrobiales bacterium]
MPEIKDVTDEITKVLRDAAYVVVGFGVLTFQRAQVRRQELVKRLEDPRAQVEGHFDTVRGQFTDQVKRVDDALEQVMTKIEDSLDPVGDRLPPQARDLLKQAQSQAREARQQIRSLLLSNAA